VFDAGGSGGVWDPWRDRPARAWAVEGAPGWWTVALANWDDERREVATALADLGIPAGRFRAYDVWRNLPLDDVRTHVSARLDAHTALTIGLRPVATHPQVVGTTRHVVQGALDVVDEHWDAAQRTLRARATALDARAYAVTVAAPKGQRPVECTASRSCTLRRLDSGHVVIEWPAGGGADDLEWAVRFQPRAGP
jgi:hypothetical protein